MTIADGAIDERHNAISGLKGMLLRKFAIVVAALFAALALILAWFTYRLSAAATEIAAGNPFCLIVPKTSPFGNGYSYQAASNWLDTTPLIMQGQNWLYHAVLVVDHGARITQHNWSYTSMSFRSDMRAGVDATGSPLICRTGNSLRGGLLGDDGRLTFIRDRIRWSIDYEYQPSASYGGDLFTFYAVEPAFQALSIGETSPFGNAYWVISVGLGNEQLARERRSMEQMLNSNFYQRPGYQVFAERDQGKNLVAAIGCTPPTIKNPRSCQHQFIHAGMTFSFRHAPMAKEDWIKARKNLYERVLSFKQQ